MMRHKSLVVPALAALLLVGSTELVLGQTTATTPGPVTEDDDDGDSDWGWIGLLGLAGLAGLYRKREPVLTTTTTSGGLNR